MLPWNEPTSVSHPQPYTKSVNKWHPGSPSYWPQNHLGPQTCLSTGWRNIFWNEARAVTILDWRKCPGRRRKEGGVGRGTTAPSEEIRAKSYFCAGRDLDLPTNLNLLQAFALGVEEKANIVCIKDSSAGAVPKRQCGLGAPACRASTRQPQLLRGGDLTCVLPAQPCLPWRCCV